jgi:hypothetical protein
MNEFQIFSLCTVGGIAGAVFFGMLIGYLLPATAVVNRFTGHAIGVMTVIIIGLAVTLTLSAAALGNVFAVLPYWSPMAIGGCYLVTIGAHRGVDLRIRGE